jgi:hypothetical protein
MSADEGERQQLIDLVNQAPAHGCRNGTRVRALYLEELISMPQEARDEHLSLLISHESQYYRMGAHEDDDPLGFQTVNASAGQEALEHANRENVMSSDQIAWADEAIDAIERSAPKPISTRKALSQLDALLDRLGQAPASGEGLHKLRDGKTEIALAREALHREHRAGDLTARLDSNPPYHRADGTTVGLTDLLARVWTVIGTKDPGVRTRLEEAVVHALAECIERDGHRVCNVGCSQRLLRLCQGEVDGIKPEPPPPPGSILSAFGEELDRELKGGEPGPERQDRLAREVRQRGRELYEPGSGQARLLESQLTEYFRYEYQREPPPLEEASDAEAPPEAR